MKTFAALLLILTLFGCATVISVAESRNTFVTCRVADTATTMLAVHTVVGTEANPLMAALIAHGWLPFVGVELAVAGLAWYYWDRMSPAEQVAANVVGCLPVVNNAAILIK